MTQNKLPDWLRQDADNQLPKPKCRWVFTNYLDKTLLSIYRILAEDADTVNASNNNGILQQVEPLIKLIGIIAIIIAAAATQGIVFLMGLNLLNPDHGKTCRYSAQCIYYSGMASDPIICRNCSFPRDT